MGCPRFAHDRIPCNFGSKYFSWQLPPIPGPVRNRVLSDRFSYLVFKKGPNNNIRILLRAKRLALVKRSAEAPPTPYFS